MPPQENEHQKGEGNSGGKGHPRQNKKVSKSKRVPSTKKKVHFAKKIGAVIAAFWAIGQPVFGAFSGHWRDPWFIVLSLVGIFLLALFGCWFVSARRVWWILTSVVCLVALPLIGRQWHSEVLSLETLQPANEPTPPIPKAWEANDFTNVALLFAGGGVYAAPDTRPFSLISYNDESLLSIQKTAKGAWVSGQFFGPNGDIVAVIETNRFRTNPENIFRLIKDKHSLIIRDKRNVEIVNIRYLNPSTFAFTGVVRLPSGETVEITKDEIISPRLRTRGGGSWMPLHAFGFDGPRRK